MTAEDVLEVVRLLESHAISVWLDGGWGVDALLGEQRRPHKDLDLVMSLGDVEKAMRLLSERGFAPIQGGAPKSFVLEDTRGRSLDIHPVRFDDQGGGVYRMNNDEDWIYPAPGFAGSGVVGGQSVRCLTPRVQMLCHTGYEFGEKDVAEVLALHERFGVDVPEPYRKYLEVATVATKVQTTIAPMLTVRNGMQAVEFYKKAFGAVETGRLVRPDGGIVATMTIDDAAFGLTDEAKQAFNLSPETLGGTSVRINLIVADPDGVAERAVAAGAKVLFPVADQSYGMRQGRVIDPFGHHWLIGRPLS